MVCKLVNLGQIFGVYVQRIALLCLNESLYTGILCIKNKNKLGLSKNLELCLKKEILVSEQDFFGEGLRDPLSYSDRPVRFMF